MSGILAVTGTQKGSEFSYQSSNPVYAIRIDFKTESPLIVLES